MSLLSRERSAIVRTAQRVQIHGDSYVDLAVTFPEAPGSLVTGRVPHSECPADLEPGAAVSIRFVMNVMVSVRRT